MKMRQAFRAWARSRKECSFDRECVIAWTKQIPSVTVYDSIEQVITIHGHDGKTELRWLEHETRT